MVSPDPELIAADLSQLVTPGLRSPRVVLVALPHLRVVQCELATGARSLADAVERVMNRGLDAMAAQTDDTTSTRLADPVRALRAVLALRPGTERVKSKTRRYAAAQAMGLLSGEGWRAHHEKGLLLDLAKILHSLESEPAEVDHRVDLNVQSLPIDGHGIERFYSDFVDVGADWESLFESASTLDLAVMYSATWRNTYRKHLHAIAERSDGRIRAVLPDPSADSILIPAYAHTLGITPDDLRGRVQAAVCDFQSLRPGHHVEIYLTTRMFRHAIYMFSDRAILALYALCSERIATPALRVSHGELLSFLRVDFDHLIEQSDRIF